MIITVIWCSSEISSVAEHLLYQYFGSERTCGEYPTLIVPCTGIYSINYDKIDIDRNRGFSVSLTTGSGLILTNPRLRAIKVSDDIEQGNIEENLNVPGSAGIFWSCREAAYARRIAEYETDNFKKLSAVELLEKSYSDNYS